MPFLALPALAMACLPLSGCLLKDQDEEGLRPLAVETTEVGSFLADGKLLILTPKPFRYHTCFDGERREHVIEGIPDTLEFAIAGTVLSLYERPMPDEPETAEIEPTLQVYSTWQRVGEGDGIEGAWRVRGMRYRVLWGQLNDSLKGVWDWRMKPSTLGLVHSDAEMELRDGRFLTRLDRRWADFFVAEWNGDMRMDPSDIEYVDSARYEIRARALDRSTVELASETSGEVVRISFAADGTRSFTSTAEGRKPYSDDLDEAPCPPDSGTNWYYDFLAEHWKRPVITPKRGDFRGKSRIPARFPLFPLNSLSSFLN